MAHIFKHPGKAAKGIIVFTHKEIAYFFNGPPRCLVFRPCGFPVKIPWHLCKQVRHQLNRRYFWRQIARISKDYFIGVHIGWLQQAQKPLECIDFYMATGSVADFQGPAPFIIPLRSRNFTPSTFQRDDTIPKYWDILCVSRNKKTKNLDLFLKQIRQLYDQGHNYRVLLIVPTLKAENAQNDYVDLVDDYYRMFSAAERDRFTLLKLSEQLSFLGLSHSQLSFFYNASKVLTLFSAVEGGPKVISEALRCGLPIVVKDDLAGGGRDFLDETNSVQFHDFDKAYEALSYAVENYNKLNVAGNTNGPNRTEEESLKTLKGYFTKLYEKHGQVFDGELINTDRLSLRLPSHMVEEIPWSKGLDQPSDILSVEQFEILLQHLKLN